MLERKYCHGISGHLDARGMELLEDRRASATAAGRADQQQHSLANKHLGIPGV
jgi:hypothetical protein